MNRLLTLLLLACVGCTNPAQNTIDVLEIVPGSSQISMYLPILKGKQVGLTVNHSSTVEQTHLTDTLQSLEINIAKVFTPEHGFKGTASDGAKIEYTDQKSSFELVSLYGKNRKPTREQMQGIDIMVFDIQDVGTRFYTYISTMHYVMEACAENDIPLILLDRPNPNGSYVDGPVLDTALRSFVGMHPIPIVHGMTVGELARMINGEQWMEEGRQCSLTVIPVKNWKHATPYSLPLKPSPNLPNDLSVSLYPSLCLFEGTVMSVGRGTQDAFQQIGHPDYPDTTYSFIPKSWEGSKWPPYENEKCYGVTWAGQEPLYSFSIEPLLDAYHNLNSKDFFNSYFQKLAGTRLLQQQIEAGLDEEEIRSTWKPELDKFIAKRAKYLLYD